jgi:release factor glutamine methyltransferase
VSAQTSSVEDWLEARSPDERRDREVLVAFLTGRSRAWLYAHGDERLSAAVTSRLERFLERRRAGEPIAYLIGHREFFGLDLEVGPTVLVPRPETELLVELALTGLAPGASASAGQRVLDLGTGSGAIAIAIAKSRPDCTVSAIDVDVAALDVAERNAARHAVHIEFLASDWFEALRGRRFELIVSNPPYVAEGDPHLDALAFEPRLALAAGRDGLDALATVIGGAAEHLESRGRLIVEHGAEQGEAVRSLFARARLRDVATHRDLAGLERATLGRK